MENDIGGHALLLREFAAAGAQGVEQRIADGVFCLGVAGIAATTLAAWGEDEADRLFSAEDWAGAGAELEPAMFVSLQSIFYEQRAGYGAEQ